MRVTEKHYWKKFGESCKFSTHAMSSAADPLGDMMYSLLSEANLIRFVSMVVLTATLHYRD